MALTPAQKRIMTSLHDLSGAVTGDSDPYATILDTPSPSMNFTFDNTWGLPDGYAVLMGGGPKGGKTILLSSIIGRMHRVDPDAVAIKFNTELREKVQVTPQQKKLWGIDSDRYIAYEVREPASIFDRIETEVPRLVQAGVKLRLVAIDSVNDILGRRTMNSESVNDQQIADKAATLQDGFSRIKEVLRNNGVSLIMTTQVRTEMDQLEQRRGHKVKLAVSWYLKHLAEYFMFVEKYENKDGRTDMSGNAYEDNEVRDVQGDADTSAHKVRVTMLDSSLGRAGRVGLFTLDHEKGIINTHEEVFLLGTGFGVLVKDGAYYEFDGKRYHGKENTLIALRDDADVYSKVLAACKGKDLARRA